MPAYNTASHAVQIAGDDALLMNNEYIEKSFLYLFILSLILHLVLAVVIYRLPETKKAAVAEPYMVDLQDLPGDAYRRLLGLDLGNREAHFSIESGQLSPQPAQSPSLWQAKRALSGSTVKVASVSTAFPSGLSPLVVKLAPRRCVRRAP